jgi:hypothetical protein
LHGEGVAAAFVSVVLGVAGVVVAAGAGAVVVAGVVVGLASAGFASSA